MADRDYYEVLGVSRDASQQDIKKAYKRLVRQFHPDVATDKEDAQKQMMAINEAYGVLSDEDKKSYYDAYGRAPGQNGDPRDQGFGGFGGFSPFGDIFDSFFDMGGRGQRRANQPSRGRDIRIGISITLEEAFRGVTQDVEYSVEETCLTCRGKKTTEADGLEVCKTCNGQGQVQRQINIGIGSISQVVPCPKCGGVGQKVVKPCKECKGKGVVSSKKRVSVTVPAGVDNGMQMRVAGQGEPGTNGGPSGNLLTLIQVGEDERFTREGDDLITTKRINFTQAALGDTVAIDTIDGTSQVIKIPAGTQSNTTFRLRGKGMPRLNNPGSFGDLHVAIIVMVPTKLNDKQKKLLNEFAAAGSQEAHDGSNSIFGRIKDAIFG